MTRAAPILLTLLTLAGCNGHAAGLAGHMLAEPVLHLTVEGGKAAYQAAAEYWLEWYRRHQTPETKKAALTALNALGKPRQIELRQAARI